MTPSPPPLTGTVPPVPGEAAPLASTSGGAGVVSRLLASTPSRLRALQLATALIAVLFAVFASVGTSRRLGDLGEVRRASDSLLRVQELRVAAVRADSLASQAYLLGGLEPAATRQAFSEQIDTATSGLVAVSEQLDVAGASALAGVNADLTTYVGLVEQARANNRQGYPVGAAYQRQANALLTTAIVPSLRQVEQDIRQRVNQRLDGAADDSLWLFIPGVLLLAVLVAGGRSLSRLFRRTVNVWLLAAGAVTVLAMVLGGRALSSSMADAETAVGTNLQAADLAAQARASGFDATSQEALGLINRGNSAANETLWAQASATVGAAVQQMCTTVLAEPAACSLRGDFDRYRAQHALMRDLDNGGDWDAAVAASVGPPDTSELAASFGRFATASQSLIAAQGKLARSGIDEGTRGLGALRVVVFLLGLGAAALAMRGYGQRLAEYR